MRVVNRFLLFASLICCATIVSAQQNYSKLVAFGDSLSDTGNIASITFNFPYPFYQNRITDGPVAFDYLAEAINSNATASLHLSNQQGGFNYAVGGANIIGDDDEDLVPQINAYLQRSNNQADPNALYAIMIGGNDVRGVRSQRSSVIAESEINQMLLVLQAQIMRLVDAGARYFIVSNVANIGRIPETLQREASDPGVVARAKNYTEQFNQLLEQKLSILIRDTETEISIFDLFNEVETMMSNASSLGFTQTTVGCFDLGAFDFHPDCVFGARFDRFVFFDNLHPTGKAHRLIGEAMVKQISQPFDKPRLPIGALLLLLDE